MTCKEIHEQIRAYVGDRVDEAEYRSKVGQHIKSCPDCRATYEQELKARLVIRDRAQPASSAAPPAAVIPGGAPQMNGDGRESASHSPGSSSEERRSGGLLTSPIGIVAALLLVIVCGWVVVRGSTRGDEKIIVEEKQPAAGTGSTGAPAKSVPENLFNKAANNFTAILDGQLAVQHVSEDAQELGRYFEENGVAYNAIFLPIKADLKGGVISQHGATRLAHMIYAKGDVTLYVFEVPREILQKGDIVYVTEDVFKQLDGGKVFWEEPAGHRLAMFKKNDLICVVVSNAAKAQLSQLIGVQ